MYLDYAEIGTVAQFKSITNTICKQQLHKRKVFRPTMLEYNATSR